jgi:hypothetical protein
MFQSSLRDFSSLASLPRTASWAKVSRPFGTQLSACSRFFVFDPLSTSTCEVRLGRLPGNGFGGRGVRVSRVKEEGVNLRPLCSPHSFGTTPCYTD